MALAADDIEKVRRTWELVAKDLEGNGVIILKTYLDKYDHYNVFERFRDYPREDIETNRIFRNHALRLISNVDDIIVTLDQPDKLSEILLGISKSHRRRKIDSQKFKDLQSHLLELLKDAFKITDDELSAWKRVLSVAFDVISAELDK